MSDVPGDDALYAEIKAFSDEMCEAENKMLRQEIAALRARIAALLEPTGTTHPATSEASPQS